MIKPYFGTCSWKYDSWRGLIYSSEKKINYLNEYARHFNSVEIDQWFWSLFGEDKIVLPKPEVVAEYGASVPDNFKFTIKIPNSLTLTHYYKKKKSDPLVANSFFLSENLFKVFYERLEPIHSKIGLLMFQFEYLNKMKIPDLFIFIDRFSQFLEKINCPAPLGIEIRNPNYLKTPYFKFLQETGMAHVFLQGYYMPDIAEVYESFKNYIDRRTVLRLHGGDRKEIEAITGNRWHKIVEPREEEVSRIINIIRDLSTREVETYVNVNNHYEGSAPLTIQNIKQLLQLP